MSWLCSEKQVHAIQNLIGADIVTDLYLKSLREFKPTAAKASDAEGQVKAWSAPAPPQAPESASNVESELSAYESSEVESASSGASSTTSSESEGDWFELDTSPDREKCSATRAQADICRCTPLNTRYRTISPGVPAMLYPASICYSKTDWLG